MLKLSARSFEVEVVVPLLALSAPGPPLLLSRLHPAKPRTIAAMAERAGARIRIFIAEPPNEKGEEEKAEDAAHMAAKKDSGQNKSPTSTNGTLPSRKMRRCPFYSS